MAKVPLSDLPSNLVPLDDLPSAQSTTMAQDVLRQLALTARAAGPTAAGAALGGMVGGPPGAAVGALGVGLGQLVGDPLVNLINYGAGTRIPTPSQTIEGALTRMGLPEPATPQERVVGEMVRAGTSAAGSAKGAGSLAASLISGAKMGGKTAPISAEVLNLLARYPAQQVAGAAMAGGAGGTLRESGASPGAQVGGAMLAGMVAPGGPKLPLTQRALTAPTTMVQPFTEAGREVIVGNVLRKLATQPEQAATRLAQAQPLVPGVRPTTAATAYDPGLASAETAIRALDQSGAFATQLSANQQALLDAYRRISGQPGSIALAESKRAARTGPMREQAFETRAPVLTDAIEAQIQATLADPMKQRTTVTDAMKEVQRLINTRKAPDGTIDPAALYSVRKDISQIMSGALQGEKANLKLARGELKDLLPVIDNTIESGAPGFKAYMDKFSKMSGPIDQMRLLQDIERRVTTGQPNLMTGEPVLAAGQLRRQLANRSDEIGLELSPSAQRKLDAIINEINRGMAATAPGVKVPGSDTFRNMSMGNLIGRVFSESLADNTTLRTMTRPLDFLYKLPDQQIQQLLVEAMLDPQMASQMMSKASIMKVEPLAKSLRDKATQMGFGTAIGASQSGQ
jgi:hypothetical protein